MKINAIRNISFKQTKNETVNTTKDNSSQNAIMMLRDPNALIKFQQNQDLALKADSIDTNPIKSLGYKLYRTFNMLKETDDNTTQDKQLNLIA